MAKSRTKTPSQRAAQARRRGARPGGGTIQGQIRRPPPKSRWAAQAARRRRMIAIAGVVVLVAALVAAVAWWQGRYREPGPPAAIAAGYHITYDVTDTTNNTTTRREVSTRRPFELRDETFGADGSVQASTIINTDHSFVLTNGKMADLGKPTPSPVLGDFEFALALPELRKHGLALARGSETIAGRACRVYRIGGALGTSYTKPTATEHADVCVDRDGLVLLEDWTTSGKEVRKTTATAVDTAVPPDSTFQLAAGQPADPIPANVAGQVVLALPVNQPPSNTSQYWLATKPPWGLKDTARVRTTSIQSVGGAVTPGPGALIDAYTNGSHAVLVSQQTANSVATDTVAKRTVHVPRLGKGTVSVSSTGPQLVFDDGETAVVITGNVDVDHLVAFARHLSLQKGS